MTHHSPATHQRIPLVLEDISILRAPGIPSGFTLDNLSPDITIVFGPNASGKSTTARAIQMVLWPHASALRGHHVAATFTLGDEHWRIEASAAGVRRTRDGEPAEAPLIAPLDDRSRYALALPDLLASENLPLAQAILNESSGGFDLPMVAESLGFNDSIPPRLESARRVQAASAALQQALQAAEETRVALGERPHLLGRRDESLRAERDIEAIDRALEYRRLRSDEADAEAEIAAYPQHVQAFTGDEPAEIERLARAIAEQQRKLAEIERQRDRWQAMVDSSGLGEIDSPEDRLKALRTIQSQQEEIAALLASAERDLAAAMSERQAHQHRIADDLNDDQIAALDSNGIRELADIAATYEDVRARRVARDEVELWLGGVRPPQNLDALREGVETLQARLQHPNAAEHGEITGRARWVGIIAGLLVAVAGAVLALQVDPLWWLLALAGVVVMLLAWRFTASESAGIAAELERQYSALALPQPDEWRAGPVRDLLGQLRNELKVAMVEQEKADRWQDLEQERAELDAMYAANEDRREQAIARYGVAPDLKEESLRLLAENLGRWQAADATVRSLEARVTRLQSDGEVLQHRADSVLAELGYESGELSLLLDDIQRRIDTLHRAQAERDALQQEIDTSVQPQLQALEADRDAIYSRFGLEPDDNAGIRALSEQRASLLAARNRLEQRQQATRQAWEALTLTPHWRDQDVDQLAAARNAALEVANRRDQIEERLRDLDQRERAAIRSRDIEKAQAALASARADLAADRERIAASVTGNLLLGTVQRETRDAALPIVFHRARELFAIITRGKYELQFEAGPPPEFTALDTATGFSLSLDQLSSGTRVQLLMAIRLAFVENVEIGPKLPVILDETLGNSDEFRASAIIDAAIDISNHGRQVFYFTAQGEEVARWQHRIEAMPEHERPTLRVIELTEVRRDAGFERLPIPKLGTVRTPALPSPADHDDDTWAAMLRVPGIDPWAPIGSVHVWHLLDNREVLHALLSNDISTFGQLHSLQRTNPAQLEQIHPDLPELMPEVQAHAHLLDDAIGMWRIGRARPMPEGALAEADMIDPADRAELQAILEESGNDGAALIERLQTMDDPPLVGEPLEALERWLISEGYMSPGQPMSADAVRSRLFEAGSPAIEAGGLDAQAIERILAQTGLW